MLVLRPNITSSVPLPLYSSKVSAGFPSPADDYVEDMIDLNDLLIHNKPATYLLRVVGDSMKDAGIFDGDLLVVDASVPPVHNKIVIANVNGEFVVKRLWRAHGQTYLKAENPEYAPIHVSPEQEMSIFGVVTGVVRVIK